MKNFENLKKIKILLAEDNEDDIVIIKEVFKDLAFVEISYVVSDGEAAIACLRQEPPYQHVPMPNLVILDISMPKKTGLEVLEEIQRDPNLKGIPTVMLTSSEREEDIVKAYKNGACTYLVKPMTYQSFVEIAKSFGAYWGMYARVPSRPDKTADGGTKQ